MIRMLVAASATLMVAACATPPGDPLARVQDDPQLRFQIASFYDRNAQEGGFNCGGVRMSGITRSEVLSREDGRVEVAVTYHHTIDDTPPFEFSGARCIGFAQRVFTLVERPGGRFDVVAMTGEQRGG
jgi:hypothetical protein